MFTKNFHKRLIFAVLTVITFSFLYFTDNNNKEKGVSGYEETGVGVREKGADAPFSRTPTPVKNNQPKTNKDKTEYKVTYVIDGDTIRIIKNGKSLKVRLLGINAPETGTPGSYRKRECFGMEALAYARKIISDNNVSLETDDTQSKYDKYGRLLAYIYLPDGSDVGEKMIKDGYAYEYTYRYPYKKQKLYKQAEEYAKQHNLGLWAPGACAEF